MCQSISIYCFSLGIPEVCLEVVSIVNIVANSTCVVPLCLLLLPWLCDVRVYVSRCELGGCWASMHLLSALLLVPIYQFIFAERNPRW